MKVSISNNSFGLAAAAIAGTLLATSEPNAFASSEISTNSALRVTENPYNQTMASLLKPITMNFKDARLEDMVNAISKAVNTNIEVLWGEGSGASSMNRDSTFSFEIKGKTLKQTLEVLSRQLLANGVSATWQVLEDGTLQFGPKSSLNRFAETKIYDVKDLLKRVPDFTNAPTIDLSQALQGGTGGSIFREGQNPQPTITPNSEKSLDELISLIQQLVEPEQWDSQGGTEASIKLFQGNLIVKAAPYIHRALK